MKEASHLMAVGLEVRCVDIQDNPFGRGIVAFGEQVQIEILKPVRLGGDPVTSPGRIWSERDPNAVVEEAVRHRRRGRLPRPGYPARLVAGVPPFIPEPGKTPRDMLWHLEINPLVLAVEAVPGDATDTGTFDLRDVFALTTVLRAEGVEPVLLSNGTRTLQVVVTSGALLDGPAILSSRRAPLPGPGTAGQTAATVVRQWLKLATVSPKLLEIYAEDQMSLEQLMVFTLVDDHIRQGEVWEAPQSGPWRRATSIGSASFRPNRNCSGSTCAASAMTATWDQRSVLRARGVFQQIKRQAAVHQ
jgi:hypothetical protein